MKRKSTRDLGKASEIDANIPAAKAKNAPEPIMKSTASREIPSEEIPKDNQNLLFLSAWHGDIPKLKESLNKGAQVDGKSEWHGQTALSIAILEGHKDIVEILLENGANPNGMIERMIDAEQRTALMAAVVSGNNEIVELLIEHGAKMDEKDEMGRTALMIAARTHKDIVKFLLEKGANLNEKDGHHGNNALNHAVKAGNKHIAELLIDNGTKVDEKNEDGQTALMIAINHSDRNAVVLSGVVELLIEKGANVNEKDNEGRTPLMHAYGEIKIAEFLLANGAKVDEKNDDGETALIEIAHSELPDAVKLLIDNGADINEKDNSGKTALMIAQEYGNEKVVKVLLDHGAR